MKGSRRRGWIIIDDALSATRRQFDFNKAVHHNLDLVGVGGHNLDLVRDLGWLVVVQHEGDGEVVREGERAGWHKGGI